MSDRTLIIIWLVLYGVNIIVTSLNQDQPKANYTAAFCTRIALGIGSLVTLLWLSVNILA